MKLLTMVGAVFVQIVLLTLASLLLVVTMGSIEGGSEGLGEESITKTKFLSLVSPKSDQCICEDYSPDMTTVVVKDSTGNLGNKMFTYLLMNLVRKMFNVRTYITEGIHSFLSFYFKNVNDIPVAEHTLCGFKQFYEEFIRRKVMKQKDMIKDEVKKRVAKKEETVEITIEGKTYLVPSDDKDVNIEGTMNSQAFYDLEIEVDEENLAMTNYPWEALNKEMNKTLESCQKSSHILPGRLSIIRA